MDGRKTRSAVLKYSLTILMSLTYDGGRTAIGYRIAEGEEQGSDQHTGRYLQIFDLACDTNVIIISVLMILVAGFNDLRPSILILERQ
jgi:hypothetical protein